MGEGQPERDAVVEYRRRKNRGAVGVEFGGEQAPSPEVVWPWGRLLRVWDVSPYIFDELNLRKKCESMYYGNSICVDLRMFQKHGYIKMRGHVQGQGHHEVKFTPGSDSDHAKCFPRP